MCDYNKIHILIMATFYLNYITLQLDFYYLLSNSNKIVLIYLPNQVH